jgi:FdhD protein
VKVSRRPGPTTRRVVHEIVDHESRRRPDTVVTEEPLEIRLTWPGTAAHRVAVTMRTPGADFELAAGFLLSEGVVEATRPPHTIAYCTDVELSPEQEFNVVTVEIDGPPRRHPGSRSTTMTSACGVCGTQSIDEIFLPEDDPVPLGSPVEPTVISSLPDLLAERQRVFSRTGSLHAAGVFDGKGGLILAREDVGRHNAVDKVLGARQLGTVPGWSSDDEVLLCVSGRVGFDIITKAVAGRIGTIVAVGGPSSLALDLADRAGITVCGFTRGSRFVVYTHPGRVIGT